MMKHLHITSFFLVAGLLVMASCSERAHRAPASESVTLPTVEQQPASVTAPKEPASPKTETLATTTMEKKKPASQNATPSSARNETDNLRGWDTTSEDDTHDNGMQRYMENDDDEGWN